MRFATVRYERPDGIRQMAKLLLNLTAASCAFDSGRAFAKWIFRRAEEWLPLHFD